MNDIYTGLIPLKFNLRLIKREDAKRKIKENE
jgi:hypothetical protein